MSKEIESWIAQADADQQAVLQHLRATILEVAPGAAEELKWSRPCYGNGKGLFCYLQRSKKHITLGFQNGARLDDPRGLLEGAAKDMRHIKLRSLDEARSEHVVELVRQAGAL